MIRNFFHRPGFMPVLLVLLIIIAGCGKKPAAETKVVYRLKWLFNISVVGDLYADAQGYFAQEGLAVEIKPGGPERDAIKELEIGHAQFGVASADQVIRAVAKGSPVVVIAQLFQVNPLQWLYRPGKVNINRPQDLQGKTLGITYGGNDETIMRALLAKYNIKESRVNFFSVRYDYTPFYQGKVDLWPVYQNAEGLVIAEKLRRHGEQVRFFNPDAFGVRFVANSIITSRRMMAEHPETVKKFRRALLRGWQQALDPANAARALEIMHKFDPDTPMAVLKKQLAATRPLIAPPGIAPGAIDTAAWRQTAKIMRRQKLISGPVTVTEFLQPAPSPAD